MSKVVIATPVYKGVTPRWVHSLFCCMEEVKRSVIGWGVEWVYTERIWIASAYWALVEKARRFNPSKVIFLEEDIVPDRCVFSQLITSPYAVTSAVYPTPFYPHKICAYWFLHGGDSVSVSDVERTGERFLEVDWVGLGCVCVDSSVLIKLAPEAFYCDEGKASDYTFSMWVRQRLGKSIAVDMMARCSHLILVSKEERVNGDYQSRVREEASVRCY